MSVRMTPREPDHAGVEIPDGVRKALDEKRRVRFEVRGAVPLEEPAQLVLSTSGRAG